MFILQGVAISGELSALSVMNGAQVFLEVLTLETGYGKDSSGNTGW